VFIFIIFATVFLARFCVNTIWSIDWAAFLSIIDTFIGFWAINCSEWAAVIVTNICIFTPE